MEDKPEDNNGNVVENEQLHESTIEGQDFSKQVNSAAWFMLWLGLGIAAIGVIGLWLI